VLLRGRARSIRTVVLVGFGPKLGERRADPFVVVLLGVPAVALLVPLADAWPADPAE
jgi:hypothetical protein